MSNSTGYTPETATLPVEEFQRRLTEIEDDFWKSRQSLQQIYEAALSHMTPPWGVLAVVAARTLCLLPPQIVLPPIIGGVGSLNSFFALVSPSGGGKGAAVAVACQLVPQFVIERKLGSGEGFIKILEGNKGDPASKPEAVWFDAAEIDGLKAMSDRAGSTLLEKLRDAWSGASLGFGYKDDSFIERHSYRMTLTLGVQPSRAGWLLADGGGGTPQRFLFFPAFDARCTRADRDPSYWIAPLSLPPLTAFQYPTVLTVPAEVADEIAEAHEMKMRGLGDGLDSHALFAREKFAYVLCVIDGRTVMNLEDWRLAGIAAQVSTHTRDYVMEGLRAAQLIYAEDRGELRGVENWAAEQAKDQQTDKQIRQVTHWLVKKLADAGAKGMTRTELTLAVEGRNRKCLMAQVLPFLEVEKVIRIETTGEGKGKVTRCFLCAEAAE